MQDIKGFSLEQLEQTLESWGSPAYHARQIFSWIYQKGCVDFDLMSNLPSGLRERLKKAFFISSLKLIKTLKSSDRTEKFLFELKDRNLIEAVSIPMTRRAPGLIGQAGARRCAVTGCISSQVGCKFCCSFCASGTFGFKRNLSSGEILDEVLFLKNNSSAKKLTHIVFMGTGEPFDNYEEVLKAIKIINSPAGFNIGARRITISTCGLTPGIKKLSDEGMQVELSVSLHAADEKTRDLIMPVNKIYPLKTLIPACRQYYEKTDRQITFEYILIKGVNSDLKNAIILGKLLVGMDAKVNLIPANTIKELKVEAPAKVDILEFKNTLFKSCVNVTLRKSRGADIDAACGQLRLKYESK